MPKYQVAVKSGPSTMRASGDFAVTGTTYAYTALSDGTDTTYCKVSSGTTLPVDMTTGYPVLGSGERIVSVCPWVRSKQPGGKTCRALVALAGWTPPEYAIAFVHEGIALNLPKGVSTIADYEVAAQNGQLLVPSLGVEWSTSLAGTTYPYIVFYDPHSDAANRALWYRAGLNFYALKPATVANPAAPAGTVSTTQHPACTATVSAVVESWQKPSGLSDFMTGITMEWSVYAGSLTLPAGPPVSKWTTHHTIGAYIDGTTASTLACSTTPPGALENGDYTLFVRVSRDHPSGTPAWSAYAYKQWTQNVPNPAPPALTLTKDDANQRVKVEVNASAATGYDSGTAEVQVQRQVAGAWRDVRGTRDAAIAIGSTVIVGYDLEADRGATNTYRARVSMWHTADAVRRYSTWDSETVAGPTGGTWNLKAVEAPAASLLNAQVAEKPSETSQAPAAVIEPLDRDRPVVLLGILGGFSGALELACTGATPIAAVKALESYRGVVYLEDAFGEARWVAITKVSWNREGTPSAPRRVATIEYVEVDSGLGGSGT